MAIHPLSKISEQYNCTGYYTEDNQSTDQYGNPKISSGEPVNFKIMIKPDARSKFSTQPDGRIITLINCYLITENVKLERLQNEILVEDGRKIYILDRFQAVLKPINKVFGYRFKAYHF